MPAKKTSAKGQRPKAKSYSRGLAALPANAKNLVIVESPAKGKTIEKYLGAGFAVRASMGHIRDLPARKSDLPEAQRKLPFASLAVDTEHDFEPLYIIPADKKKIVADLRAMAKKVDKIWLATDRDREGEAIAWHLCEVLKLDPKKTARIVFHEITKTAIEKAVKNPELVDLASVDAQQARRILDRLVGFPLSSLLWKKIRFGLSAGRVQSVAVRIVVERERERRAFEKEEFAELLAEFLTEEKEKFSARLEQIDGAKVNSLAPRKPGETKRKISGKLSAAEAEELKKKLAAGDFRVAAVEKKTRKSSPPPPFTTASLQRDASTRLGFPISKTMRAAQKLYEAGRITYMRTDSLNLSKDAVAAARKEIGARFGKEFLPVEPRFFATKSKGAQEAHEAIRPTSLSSPANLSKKTGADEEKLYDLIWRRTLACQMEPARLAGTRVEIETEGS